MKIPLLILYFLSFHASTIQSDEIVGRNAAGNDINRRIVQKYLLFFFFLIMDPLFSIAIKFAPLHRIKYFAMEEVRATIITIVIYILWI